MRLIKVLVTGAGSGVGQGILKALRKSSLPLTIVAADIEPFATALYRADAAILIPRVEDEGSLAAIIDRIKKNEIHVVLIGSEFEIEFFARHRSQIESETGCTVVVSPLETIKIANDKWETAEFLKRHAMPHAPSFLPQNAQDAALWAQLSGYPIILKPRRGTSSRHVHVIQSQEEMARLYDDVPHPLVQKMLSLPKAELDREYTCSVFKCMDGTLIGPFTARRALKGGHSWVVEVAPFPELTPLMIKIGTALDSVGPLNVQLIMTKDGPVPFEINARFSGTTPIRAHFGFNEPEMAIRNFHLQEPLSPPDIGRGMALRYFEEVFLDNASPEDAHILGKKGKIESWF